jgi:endonuclease YncB( thermonuclease family)
VAHPQRRLEMNERIQELINQSTEHDYTTWDSYNQKELVYYKFNKEKFAELIVKECWALVDHNNKQYIKAQFKELFGVEE